MEGTESVLPWLLNYFFAFVGAVSLLKALKLLFLFVAAEFKSVDLTRFGVGSWAVVTGATDGIGKGFVEELASRGFNIYQVSRNPDKLKVCEDALTSKYNVQVLSRAWDFTRCSTDLAALTKFLADDLEGKDVSILVNNVGISAGQSGFEELKHSALNDVLSVNCLSITYMTRLLMPKLQQRQLPSAVINLSSVAGTNPTFGSVLYVSSKKFDDCFTVNLASNPGNVTYMTLRPGFVLTPLTSKIKNKPLEISANDCASTALRDLGSHLSFTGHFKHKALAVIMSWVPESIGQRMKKPRVSAKGKHS
jgi:short-subunit dehydrogenase